MSSKFGYMAMSAEFMNQDENMRVGSIRKTIGDALKDIDLDMDSEDLRELATQAKRDLSWRGPSDIVVTTHVMTVADQDKLADESMWFRPPYFHYWQSCRDEYAYAVAFVLITNAAGEIAIVDLAYVYRILS